MGGGTGEPVAAPRVPSWARPGELATEGAARVRRTVRDWAVDTAAFLIGALWWLWAYRDFVEAADEEFLALVSGWMVMWDPWVGAAGCLLLWWRRRFPLALAIAAVLALMVSSTITGVVLVALFTVAVHRSWLPATLVTGLAVAQGVWFSLLYQPSDLPQPVFTAYAVLMFAVPLGWGMMVRLRRQLLLNLRREAQRERDAQEQRLEQARRTERARIAREMHDVLAHRISLLSVHAGALAYRSRKCGSGPALSPAELDEGLEVIRDSAHRALTELGEVLAVLRADDPDAEATGREAPQPQLADLSRLVTEARAAGQRVELALDEKMLAAPEQEQRTAYRIVQEGLTNARKHAPHAPVTVHVDGVPTDSVQVTVANPLPVALATAEIPGVGAGLAGLTERVALDGGTLEHGAVDGQFRLRARLPWQRE